MPCSCHPRWMPHTYNFLIAGVYIGSKDTFVPAHEQQTIFVFIYSQCWQTSSCFYLIRVTKLKCLSHFQRAGVCTRQAHNRLGGRRSHETKLAVSEFPPSRPQERPSLQQTSVASETATRCINMHPHNLDIISSYISSAIMCCMASAWHLL